MDSILYLEKLVFVCAGIFPKLETIKFLYFTDYALLITEKSFTEMLN